MNISNIHITNHSDYAQIDIEGVIGKPEELQFDVPGQRVATYKKMSQALARIKGIGQRRVQVNIRSVGGGVNDAILIHDALVSLKAEVTTTCYGYVASAATIIAQAASGGRRRISENSLYLVHQTAAEAEGNRNSIGRTADLLSQSDDKIAAIYARRSGRTPGFYAELMARNDGNGQWLTPEQVIEAGLADEIVPASASDEGVVNHKSGMRIRLDAAWKNISNFLGFANVDAPEHYLSESDLARIDDGLAGQERQIDGLKNRLAGLQSSDASKVGPTQTQPREDPSIEEAARCPNDESYRMDALSFK